MEFNLFPKLPQELQDRIWMFVSHHERAVEVLFCYKYKVEKHLFVSDIAAVLHTCHASRLEALRCYTNLATKNSLNGCYINFKSDYLYICENFNHQSETGLLTANVRVSTILARI
jgi:hypothetical protein